jgi:hypothetical protein
MAKPPIIKVTRNYSLFDSHNPDNRPLNEDRHKKLRESLREYGHLPYWPIVVHKNGTGKLKVDDGQHRLHFAEKMGLPVYYIESTHDFDIAKINTTQAAWTLRDFAQRFSDAGNHDYTEAIDYANKHSVALSVAFAVLCGQQPNGVVKDKVESGEFSITDREYAERFALTYVPIAAISKNVRTTIFQQACMAVCHVADFEPSRLVRNAAKNRDKLESFSTRDAHLTMIEELYNLRYSKKIPLKFLAIEALAKRNPCRRNKGNQAA